LKYFYDEDRLDPSLLPLYLIANELAERNRLKRIEIEWTTPEISDMILELVKEDQAN